MMYDEMVTGSRLPAITQKMKEASPSAAALQRRTVPKQLLRSLFYSVS